MSFDLMVFEKSRAPKTYEDFLDWSAEQTNWKEERDYDSLEGTSPCLAAWFMEMKETFPPLNGPYSPDDEALDDRNIENHLTDYSIGSDIIYAAFAWSTAEEASALAEGLAKKHGVGFFDPQTANIVCDGMLLCKICTESGDERAVVWEQIEREILSLDDPARGSSFVTMWFQESGNDEEFLQCMPDYPRREGFLKRLFGGAPNKEKGIASYTVEASTGEKIMTTQVADKEQVARVFRDYYTSRRLPDTSGWEDSGII